MAMDASDKFSIKNLVFTKAIPNYVIPAPTDGYTIYSCIDCGDKFIFENSYEYHINRKSVKINYMCRHCGQPKIFYNRCNLLSHIRSHAFKSAIINVTDLNIQPLPKSYFKTQMNSSQSLLLKKRTICNECNEDITGSGPIYKDRERHFMQYTNELHTCPICLFAMPTECGLMVHMRIHFKCPPYFCAECGGHIPNQCVNYPYGHDCEGFRMMRAASRLKCKIKTCPAFHPSKLKDHMKINHSKKVFKCPLCVVACFHESTMQTHLKKHNGDCVPLIFYQCEICPGRLVLENQMDNHLKRHPTVSVYPCWTCAITFNDIRSLLGHCLSKHGNISKSIKKWVYKTKDNVIETDKSKRIYRVVKKCDQCQSSFTYQCKFNEIMTLPNECNECPNKCLPNSLHNIIPSEINDDAVMPDETAKETADIICGSCKVRVPEQWEEIKKHFAEKHYDIKCLDVKVVVPIININKYITTKNKKRDMRVATTVQKVTKRRKKCGKPNKKYINSIETISLITTRSDNSEEFICNICKEKCDDKHSLEKHMISHRDPCMAYQCLECGKSFVVKPSFSTHLLVDHQITNPDEYIATKECYNENAFTMKQCEEVIDEQPLRENQCNICREQYENSEDLQKHFRVHGMAFLLKSKNSHSPEY